jgi:hypothetical protein
MRQVRKETQALIDRFNAAAEGGSTTMSDDVAPEEKAEMLHVLFADAFGKLAAGHFLAGTLDDLVEGFKRGDVSFRFSVDGLTVETPAPVSPPSGN